MGFSDTLLGAARRVARKIDDTYNSAVETYAPLPYRTFANTLLGDRGPITERDLTPNERKWVVEAAVAHSWGGDKTPEGNTIYKSEAYNDIGGKRQYKIANTLGRFGIRANQDGSGLVTDNYDFYTERPQEIPNRPLRERVNAVFDMASKAWKQMGTPGSMTLDPGNDLPNIALNGASRPVRIRLTPQEMQPFNAIRPTIKYDQFEVAKPIDDFGEDEETPPTPAQKAYQLAQIEAWKGTISDSLYKALKAKYSK